GSHAAGRVQAADSHSFPSAPGARCGSGGHRMTKRFESLNALRGMSEDELNSHLAEQRRELFKIFFQQATGQVENHRQIRLVRKEIARTMTVQIEMEHAERQQATANTGDDNG